MKSPLHILHLEDDPKDAALVRATMEEEGIACLTECVQTRDRFVAALEGGDIDLILSDFSLPAFDGLSAIAIAHARWPSLPVILVSGTLGEELAIDSIKSGATDYVLKERLTRLVPAVRRAMHEVEERAERGRLEAQFIEAQKMEVLGHLAAGVAHDFNNLLGIIMGYNEMITHNLPADSLLRKCTAEIQLALERAVGLTRQLLVFGSKQTVHAVVLDLNDVVQDLDQMLRRLIDVNIEMKILPESGACCVRADSGYIGQVLMNLVVNARDAMPNGGRLTISTSRVTINEHNAGSRPKIIPGAYVRLSVEDTGTGITEEVKAHLFEAFFTTKPKGKGTGLGLATCHTIVQQCGGHIDVKSQLGQGTTFEIYFPRVNEAAVVVQPTQQGPLPRGTETLLVVEDEPAVRHLARQVLEAQGYTVLTASNGQDGLHVFRENRGTAMHLVVTDVIMPLMGGKVMAEWLRIADPDIRILYTSGYTDDSLTTDGVLEAGTAFLAKPYSPGALVRKVREMLDDEAEITG